MISSHSWYCICINMVSFLILTYNISLRILAVRALSLILSKKVRNRGSSYYNDKSKPKLKPGPNPNHNPILISQRLRYDEGSD